MATFLFEIFYLYGVVSTRTSRVSAGGPGALGGGHRSSIPPSLYPCIPVGVLRPLRFGCFSVYFFMFVTHLAGEKDTRGCPPFLPHPFPNLNFFLRDT